MVSSKFSAGLPPLRAPPVCKTKLEPPEEEEEGNPEPADIVANWYDIDVTWLWFHYVFTGVIYLEKVSATHWQSPSDPPTDGEWGTFDCNYEAGQFAGLLWHMVGGALVFNCLRNIMDFPPNPNFNTETFEYTNPTFRGKMDGRYYNP